MVFSVFSFPPRIPNCYRKGKALLPLTSLASPHVDPWKSKTLVTTLVMTLVTALVTTLVTALVRTRTAVMTTVQTRHLDPGQAS